MPSEVEDPEMAKAIHQGQHGGWRLVQGLAEYLFEDKQVATRMADPDGSARAARDVPMETPPPSDFPYGEPRSLAHQWSEPPHPTGSSYGACDKPLDARIVGHEFLRTWAKAGASRWWPDGFGLWRAVAHRIVRHDEDA